jgi:hypothetical protein
METIYDEIIKAIAVSLAVGLISGGGIVWFFLRYHVEKTFRKIFEEELKPQFTLMHERINERLTKEEFYTYDKTHKEWGIIHLQRIEEKFENIKEGLDEIKLNLQQQQRARK